MTLSITDAGPVTPQPQHVGQMQMRVVDLVTDDATWPAAGEALVAGDLGFEEIIAAHIEPAGGYVLTYDHANQVVDAYQSAGANAAMDVADGEDLTSLTFRATFFGV